MAITLRKRAPFWCRGEKLKCLKVLTDAHKLDLCDECQWKFKEAAARPVSVSRAEAAPSGRMTEAEWAARLARGPIWPTAYSDDEIDAGIEAIADACSSHCGPTGGECRHDVAMGEYCERCGPIESARRGWEG